MSEFDDVIPGIIGAAIASAGARGNNEGAWMAKIAQGIGPIAAMTRPGSRMWDLAERVLSADIFAAEYVSHSLEESSTRAVVVLQTDQITDKKPDGRENIRTDRTDTMLGKDMERRLAQLAPGDRIVIWKAVETSKSDDTKKARVLAHFEKLPKWQQADTQQRQVATPDQQQGEQTKPPAARPPSDTVTANDNAVADRFNNLPGKAKANAARLLRDAGITFPNPADEDIDRFIILVEEARTASS